ncbi:MAG TPA: aminotransferase class I/II-fold pyridoxal phosphate-dependent enzyme [Dongiaceae bacterium]|jgi:cystathionine gamma-synthase|nr:aminotransferase class I/II-fold pyridoxal phosphate-dependent enzyme [Dongiaceae bacterium]
MTEGNLSPETLCAQALGWIDPTTKAIVPPIHLATTFERDPDNEYRNGRSYIRENNPSWDQVESLLTRLEGGADTLLFSSGMAAATAPFLALKPGDHVIAPNVMYWGLRKWLLGRVEWGLAVELAEMTDLSQVAALIRPGRTRLVWAESPANPMWQVVDLAALAEIAHGAGAVLAVDSTSATPMLTRPIALGADLVMHAATKYLNGHSDVLAGTLTAARKDEFWEGLRGLRTSGGAVPGSFEAWLLLRGMRTLPLRVRQCSANALHLAENLQRHPAIAEVLYPGLASHPQHALARRQMQGGFGGMLSIRVKGGQAAAIRCAARVKLWKRATSLGGVESLIEHRASIEGPGTPVPGDLLRLSAGIESAEELLGDLEQALAA